ncbi:MAG TPA: hypothetical protein VHO27_04090, partial [Angustibacter sp.]|nr:hypothetical protein [Angustibacter sp.]
MTHDLARSHGAPDHDDHHDHHDHHHDHPATWWGRLTHEVLEVFGAGHSHDAADQVDEALEADSRGRRALWLSLAALAVTAVLQAVVVV